jgi:hypothetical protein
MKKTIMQILAFNTISIIQICSFAQSYDPVGPSTNVCPGVAIRYTSPGSGSSGAPCDQSGWACASCKDGRVQDQGRNPNGSVWATVIWENTSARAGISNFCGGLNVSINAIAEPFMSGPSTVLLCGTSSIILQASVSSNTNITGYQWWVNGTDVSPTGVISTTGPQLTLNYSNWSASSTQSATVSVGTKNSCGFATEIGPPEAIPRSAWVQLSPGNINNLLVPFNFSPRVICTSTAQMTITNQPSGTTVNWVSSNPQLIRVDNPSTGAVTVNTNFNGTVTMSATVSNACGSSTQSTIISFGRPEMPLISGYNIVQINKYNPFIYQSCVSRGGLYSYNVLSPDPNATYSWSLASGINPGINTSNFYFTQNNGQLNIQPSVSPSPVYMQVLGTNSCGPGRHRFLRIDLDGCPVARVANGFTVSPNPAATGQITIAQSLSEDSGMPSNRTDSFDFFDEIQIPKIEVYNTQMQRKLSGELMDGKFTFSTDNLTKGMYVVRIIQGKKITTKQLIIK